MEWFSPPTEMKFIFGVIDCSLDIIAELKLKHIILEVDHAIYSEILDAMFRTKYDGLMVFDKIILMMRVFHIVLCMLRTIYSQFKDSGT